MNYADVLTTLLLSVRIALLATALNMPAALMLVYMTRHEFKGKNLIDGLVNLPLVMPPVTTGYVLLFILGRRGWIGSFFDSFFGIRIAFTTAAAVMAAMVVSFPLIVRSIRISMDMVDPRFERAALTLGADRKAVFFRITLPLILPGVINGVVLGFARSLGEFGATVTFAGNIEGVSRTIPLSVYSLLQVPGKEKEAGFLVLLSIFISFAAMFASSWLNQRLQKRRKLRDES
ncbi:MAG: molybdate ABC transporter permease subunit [Spirochaetales bacterium]|nr:molybdate ABC transporter permease subunit [Spirochaetales bacterium]